MSWRWRNCSAPRSRCSRCHWRMLLLSIYATSDEEELSPLQVPVPVPVMKIPFYELHRRAAELDGSGTYLLYCGQGVMSRLHASYLCESTALDIKVYAP